jgi:hypothetical protein
MSGAVLFDFLGLSSSGGIVKVVRASRRADQEGLSVSPPRASQGVDHINKSNKRLWLTTSGAIAEYVAKLPSGIVPGDS